jgi:Cytochrome c554 and c-prime
MGMALPRKLAWCVGLTILVGSMLWMSRGDREAHAQPKPGDEQAGPKNKFYFGDKKCAECHTDGKNDAVLCTCKEMKTYKEKDKHRLANEVLKGELAQRMGKALEIKDVTKDPKCISCHGVSVGDAEKHESFSESDGVSCVACHGPYREWVNAHVTIFPEKGKKGWRDNSPADKEKLYGLADLWNPVKRGNLCFSCHIGGSDPKENKVVTHDMYAAGHPPLPGVEMATFCEQMPQHWQRLAEKKPEVLRLLDKTPEKAEFEQTRLALIGGMVSFRQSMQMLASQAEETGWPELAQFDCYACHHELKNPGWRRDRPRKGTPGRPAMREWPTELVKAGLHVLGKEEELTKALQPLQDHFSTTPFGTAATVKAEANKAAAWANDKIEALEKQPLTQKTALEVLRGLCSIPDDRIPDYDSARQIAWAADVIYHELYDGKKPNNSQDIETSLKALEEQLKLKLPTGKTTPIQTALPQNMERLANYDPAKFKEAMKVLLGRLSTP